MGFATGPIGAINPKTGRITEWGLLFHILIKVRRIGYIYETVQYVSVLAKSYDLAIKVNLLAVFNGRFTFGGQMQVFLNIGANHDILPR